MSLDIEREILAFAAELRRRNQPAPSDDFLRDAPPPPDPYFRSVEICEPPELIHHVGTIEEARELIDQSILEYSEDKFPDHVLVLKVSPGVGKTYAAVQHAERLAQEGHHIFYAGPRHDFFQQIMNITEHPELWYEWLPRQDGSDDKRATCIHTEGINAWMHKGYKGHDFCKHICKYDYINNECVYHGQKNNIGKRIVYGNHLHVTLGHPAEFDFVFGDESPVQAFMNPWIIGVDDIRPYGMDNTDPLTHLVEYIRGAAEAELDMEGPALIDYLGGADTVLETIKNTSIDVTSLGTPPIHDENDASQAPFAHLAQLTYLLSREARNCKAGGDYPHRIVIAKRTLTLYLRRAVNEKMPPHVVWLDATANEHVYTEIFHRKVKVIDARPTIQGHVYQVTDRANGKSTLMKLDHYDRERNPHWEPTIKTYQALQLVDKIVADFGYKNPTVITFKDVEEIFGDYKTGHFYAERGTNAHQDADSLFIVGTPQPSETALLNQAKCIFWERDTPFHRELQTKPKKYQYVFPDGTGCQIAAAGLWADPDLTELLSTMREDEIIQSAHRSRPVQRETDIWMLTNLPIDDLVPDKLYTMTELMGAPQGVDIWQWQLFYAFAYQFAEEHGMITADDIRSQFPHMIDKTLYKYIDLLVSNYGWKNGVYPPGLRGGRPKKCINQIFCDK